MPVANAASMGKINVLSTLGQPLKAELEIFADANELSNMTARLASPDVFQKAEIPYPRVLSNLNFTLDKKSGKPVVRISSDKPIHDPFLDFLVELNWTDGRLVREYTFLLDPPESPNKAAAEAAIVAPREFTAPPPAPVQPAAQPASQPAAPTANNDGMPSQDYVPTVRPPAPQPAPEMAAPAPAPKPAAAATKPATNGDYWTVQKGDTLGEIARETRHPEVSLDQMLAGLYKTNQEAFVDRNMNRLKAGAILNIPDADSASAIPKQEARAMIQAQANDWNAYRRKLAAATESMPAATESAGSQSSQGSIGTQVADKAAPEAPKDQVKVSRSDASGKKSGGASEEDLIAKDRALKEANQRVEQLEKNVGELQKLLEMKNQTLSAMQQQALAPATPAAPATPPATAPGTPPTPTPAAQPEAPAGKAVLSSPLPPPLPAAKVAEEVAKQAAAPAPKPADDDEEPTPPSLIERVAAFAASPAGMGTAGGLLLLLLGYFIAKARKRAKETAADENLLSMSYDEDERQVDWEERPMAEPERAPSTPPPAATLDEPATDRSENYDDVDPIAEADVYIAYGRDTQAEDLLKDALKKTPQRSAVHARLLDIFARRQSISEFEDLAGTLHALTGGTGPDWEKAVELAGKLNIRTGLFAGAAAAPATPAATPEALDFETTAPAAPPAKPGFDYNSVNLDLTEGSKAPEAPASAEPEPAPSTAPAATEIVDNGSDEVSTKLDLAQAYIEMGDLDGARELLNEVLKEGGTAQQEQANKLLASLAGK